MGRTNAFFHIAFILSQYTRDIFIQNVPFPDDYLCDGSTFSGISEFSVTVFPCAPAPVKRKDKYKFVNDTGAAKSFLQSLMIYIVLHKYHFVIFYEIIKRAAFVIYYTEMGLSVASCSFIDPVKESDSILQLKAAYLIGKYPAVFRIGHILGLLTGLEFIFYGTGRIVVMLHGFKSFQIFF